MMKIKFGYVEAKELIKRVEPLYHELDNKGIMKDLVGMGASLDKNTQTPYVWINFLHQSTVDIDMLPKNYDNIEIRYSKDEFIMN